MIEWAKNAWVYLVVAMRLRVAKLKANNAHKATGKRYYVMPVDEPGRIRSYIVYGSWEIAEYNRRVKKHERIDIAEILRNNCYMTP